MRRLCLVVVGVLLIACSKPDERPAATGSLAPTTTTWLETLPTMSSTTSTAITDIWRSLAECETGGKMNNPNTGNGYHGYFQFDSGSWDSAGGGPGEASDYPYEEQRRIAQRWQQMTGWESWPTCARKLGLI